jgi:peroxiredoxin
MADAHKNRYSATWQRHDLLRLGIISLSFIVTVARCGADATVEPGIVSPGEPVPGGQAPDFILRDMDKNLVRLSDFRGVPVILNFFASWCGPCLTELPLIQEVHLKAEDQGYAVLGIVFQDSRGAIKALAEAENLTFPMVIDGDDSVGRAYRVIGPPYTFFIDSTGTVVSVIAGAMEKQTLEENLTQLLAKQPG